MTVNYSAALKYAIFSQEVYRDFSSVTFTGITDPPVLIVQAKTDTQCAILPEGDFSTIIFRGSESSVDWNTDFDTRQEQVDFKQQVIQEQIKAKDEKIYPYAGESSSDALMHRGFVTAYFSVRQQIHDYIRSYPLAGIVTAGHSLGGALATLCAVDIQYNFPKLAIDAYTYGAPKVGNDGFRDSFNRRVPSSFRFVHGMDIVPELPRWWQGYRHVNAEFRIGKRWGINFVSQRFKDHAIEKYIEVLTSLSKS